MKRGRDGARRGVRTVVIACAMAGAAASCQTLADDAPAQDGGSPADRWADDGLDGDAGANDAGANEESGVSTDAAEGEAQAPLVDATSDVGAPPDGAPVTDAGADAPGDPLGPLDPAAACAKVFGGDYLDTAWSAVVDGKGNFTVLVQLQQPTAVLNIPAVGIGVDYGGGTVPGGNLVRHLASFTSRCEHRWSRATTGQALAAGPGGEIWTLGVEAGTQDLRKYDGASGAELLVRRFPALDAVRSLTLDVTGNVLLSGALNGSSLDFGGGALSPATGGGFVVKLDTSGAFVWQRAVSWNGAKVDNLAVVAAPNGDVLMGGQHEGTFDLGGAGTPAPAPAFGELNGFFLRFQGSSGALLSGKGWPASHGYAALSRGFHVDGAGDIYVASSQRQVPGTGCSACVSFARFDAFGTPVWRSVPVSRPGLGSFLLLGGAARASGATFALQAGEEGRSTTALIKVEPGGVPVTADTPPRLIVDFNVTLNRAETTSGPSQFYGVAGARDGRVVLVGALSGTLSAQGYPSVASRTGAGAPPPTASEMLFLQRP